MSNLLPRRNVLVLGGIGTLLAGCGFRPVYMPTASGKPGVAERELAAVEVGIIGERPGQLLRQALQERFASDGAGLHRYTLSADFRIAGEALGILTDNSVTRIRLSGTVNWVLRTRDTARAQLTSGSARTLDGFNVFAEQNFATTLENEAVQRRMAEALADQVALQLATWFNHRASQAAS
jgi:LPS-assembly lipoprotein